MSTITSKLLRRSLSFQKQQSITITRRALSTSSLPHQFNDGIISTRKNKYNGTMHIPFGRLSVKMLSSEAVGGKVEEGGKSEVKGNPEQKESLEFQAETRQLLDIVTNSLYTEKEVFLRELVSNASDALEKLRHLQSANHQDSKVESLSSESENPFEIRVDTDEVNGILTVSDTGIGLTREEMISNLGTIARSGSKAFITELAKKSSEGAGPSETDPSRGIIGKFGVGFYSAFMVGEKVEVRSKSALKKYEKKPLVWSSEGAGVYDITDLNENIRQDRGSSVVIQLKKDMQEYADEKRVETVLKKYSNFVNFPIFLNGNRVNTINAVWAEEPKTISDDTYTDFYKFIANAYDEPFDKLHFRADAPLEIKALFYIPSFHSEKYGMGRMESSVSLYSRKILIESKSPDILPDWMRFIKGVVDSEDLPLSISREKAQDSSLVKKLRKVLTRKFINHLTTMARKKPEKYKDEFYKEYAHFLKEGICAPSELEFQGALSKLIYFETNKTMNGEITSLEEYLSRCTPEQKEIYYLCAPSRELAIQSPYLEAFENAGREVIFVYTAIDDFVMANLEKFEGRAIISADKSDIDFGGDDKEKDDEIGETEKVDPITGIQSRLSGEEAIEFCDWFKTVLPEKVSSCKVTNRLTSSPAVVTDSESGAMRRMMHMVNTQDGSGMEAMPLPKQQVEINPNHPIIVGINASREIEPAVAKMCVEQIYDNCLVAAGLLDDGRTMLGRLNDILLCVVKQAASSKVALPDENVSNPPTSDKVDEKD